MEKLSLPEVRTADPAPLTEGVLVMEGGAFRGVYTAGVCDVLLEHGIRFRNVAGISSGSLNGMNYVADQIGRAVRINVEGLSDSRFVGWRALLRDRGFVGFTYLLREAFVKYPFDKAKLSDPERRFAAGATDIETGEEHYFERTNCSDMEKACVASSSVPNISAIVKLDGRKYLDGVCAVGVPLDWAGKTGEKKIVAILTSERDHKRERPADFEKKYRRYCRYPALLKALWEADEAYNAQREQIMKAEQEGKLFVFAPTAPSNLAHFERDPQKLLAFYERGRADAEKNLPALLAFLNA